MAGDKMETQKTEKQINCFNCRKLVDIEDCHYWYAFDQDNLVCTECAKELKHLETAYAGLPVYR